MDDQHAKEIGINVARELLKKKCEDRFRASVSIALDITRTAHALKQLEVLPGFDRESKYAETQVTLTDLEKELRLKGEGLLDKYLPQIKPVANILADEIRQLKNLVDKDYIGEKAEDVNVLAATYLDGLVFDPGGRGSIIYTMMKDFAKCQCEKELYTEEETRKITRNQVYVELWEEEGRIHVGIQDKETGDYLISWWDDQAQAMFDKGIFKLPGLGFEDSVLKVAENIGILAK